MNVSAAIRQRGWPLARHASRPRTACASGNHLVWMTTSSRASAALVPWSNSEPAEEPMSTPLHPNVVFIDGVDASPLAPREQHDHRTGVREMANDESRSPLGESTGALESMVIGLTIYEGGALGAAFLAAGLHLQPARIDLLDLGTRQRRLEEGANPVDVDRDRAGLGTRLARRLRPLPGLLTGHSRVCSCLRGRCGSSPCSRTR
jgi:hypothetical protein